MEDKILKEVYYDLDKGNFELDDLMFENDIYMLLLEDDEMLNVNANKVTNITSIKHKFKDVCKKKVQTKLNLAALRKNCQR